MKTKYVPHQLLAVKLDLFIIWQELFESTILEAKLFLLIFKTKLNELRILSLHWHNLPLTFCHLGNCNRNQTRFVDFAENY